MSRPKTLQNFMALRRTARSFQKKRHERLHHQPPKLARVNLTPGFETLPSDFFSTARSADDMVSIGIETTSIASVTCLLLISATFRTVLHPCGTQIESRIVVNSSRILPFLTHTLHAHFSARGLAEAGMRQ